MPKQKDLKRVVRTRMRKTGESYTAARSQLLRKREPDYAALAGKSDATVKERTGRDWAAWIKFLDARDAATKPHREIAELVASVGTSDWWSQTVTVGYERIRGLRDIGQRRGGGYEINKSRTFRVPVSELYGAFANARRRKGWLPDKVAVRSPRPNKALRFEMGDGTTAVIWFLPKGAGKSAAGVQHVKLPDRATATRMKTWWTERFEALSKVLDGI